MNNVGINSSAFANVVTPFSPVGRQAVGLENAEAKEDVLAPVEEAEGESPAYNNSDQRQAADVEDRRPAQAERTEEERIEAREERLQQRQEAQQIAELAARDREVRAHEQAHTAVGGQYAGAPSYSYERGPNGVRYATSGEVPISLPLNSGNPQETLQAAQQVRRAALAPANPSAQDQRIAAQAASLAREAQAALAEQRREEQRSEQTGQAGDRETGETSTTTERDAGAASPDDERRQRLEELRAAGRRSTQLSEQLVTPDTIQRDRQLGAVLDQLA